MAIDAAIVGAARSSSRRSPSARSSTATHLADVGDDAGEHLFRSIRLERISADLLARLPIAVVGDSVKAVSGMPSSASIPSPSGLGRAEQRHLVDQIGRDESAADRIGPASTITRVMPRPASVAQHRGKIEPAVGAGDAQQLRRPPRQRRLMLRLRRCHRRRPSRACCVAEFASLDASRKPQLAVEHDAHRRTLLHAGQPAGQAADRPTAPCRCRSAPHRSSRASGARARAPPRR